MTDQAVTFLDRVRKPEYTGENRCVPCTLVNVVIALVGSAFVGLVSPVLGVVAFAGSIALIYLRGYLVPGTPEFTKRYVPDRVLARFDTHPVPESTEDDEDGTQWETLERLEEQRRNAVDPEQFLLEEGIVEPCGEDLCFTDEFAALLDAHVERYRDEPVARETVADMFDLEPEDVSFEDREYPAIKVSRRIRKWPGDAALVADAATHEALCERTERWMDVPFEQRVGMLESLRSFHVRCPLCSGDVALGSDTVESCCRSYEVRALACADCAEPLLEFDPEGVETRETDKGFIP
ncbi:hypothetical protein [Natronobeatus ordinarius]|uniref:hypothetical protein n=1 Tax=Natronobeatus ordinarius TaxID=2963433 RepID=UPI0020CC79E5|nr:hypothetical protein [Natronobeatus ordinarius]